jgi:signal transduction histidine kinase
VVFSVADNGTGIAEENLGKIFSPIVSTEGTAMEKGTGIGLMLCKEFVINNGGKIWVESMEGKGAVFYFSLKRGA